MEDIVQSDSWEVEAAHPSHLSNKGFTTTNYRTFINERQQEPVSVPHASEDVLISIQAKQKTAIFYLHQYLNYLKMVREHGCDPKRLIEGIGMLIGPDLVNFTNNSTRNLEWWS